MKIIFLDIDGVLNSRAYDRARDWNVQSDIDETRLPLVKKIVDAAGADIVLSSTWRAHWDKNPENCDADGKYINAVFGKAGLCVYGKTPDLGLSASRREEIKTWLDAHADIAENFVVIDDDRYDWGELADNVVVTDPIFRHGLENEHVEKAIAILNNQA